MKKKVMSVLRVLGFVDKQAAIKEEPEKINIENWINSEISVDNNINLDFDLIKKVIPDANANDTNFALNTVEEGYKLRNVLNLGKVDEKDYSLSFNIPQNLFISKSFFIGLFKESLDRLGIEQFCSKYKFTIKDDINKYLINSYLLSYKTFENRDTEHKSKAIFSI